MKTTAKNKGFFILIFIGALLPLIISWVYLKIYQSGTNLSLKNNGILFEQTLKTADFNLHQLNSFLDQDKWIFLQVFTYHCQNQCAQRVSIVSNITVSLGKNSQRVIPVIFYSSEQKARLDLILEKHSHQNKLITIQPEKLDNLLQALNKSINQAENLISLFVIDPLGRFVLAFDDDLNYKQISADLKVLLKSSLIG